MLHIQVIPKSYRLFAEVSGVDLKAPVEDPILAEINTALLSYGVLMFRDQHLSDDEQVAFSERFGPLEDDLMDPTQHVAFMSNERDDGSLIDPEDRLQLFMRANQLWHSDSTFLPAPARLSFLSCRKMPPEGGETEFADMQAAYQALPAERRRDLDGLIVEHDFQRSRRKTGHEFNEDEKAKWPPLPHPLVRTHEETGERALYVGAQADKVLGMPAAEGAAFLDELRDWCGRDEFVYTHAWQEGDLIIWDNRRVNHRGRPWDSKQYGRVHHRTTVKGTGPTMENGQPVDELARWRHLKGDAFKHQGVTQNRAYVTGSKYRHVASYVSATVVVVTLAVGVWLGMR